MKYRPLLFLVTIMLLSVASSAVDELSFDPATFPGEQTAAGKMLEDRIMAQGLIDHGKATMSPEAILVGVQILHKNPVVDAEKSLDRKMAPQEISELKELVETAVSMRPEDELLSESAARVMGELEEKSRGLAGGPKRWTVTIRKGEHYLLDPRLVYDVQQEAIVSARVVTDSTVGAEAAAANVTIGITVARDGSASNLYTRAVARNKTQVRWNSGPYKSGWYVKIHHLSGPAEARIVIETN